LSKQDDNEQWVSYAAEARHRCGVISIVWGAYARSRRQFSAGIGFTHPTGYSFSFTAPSAGTLVIDWPSPRRSDTVPPMRLAAVILTILFSLLVVTVAEASTTLGPAEPNPEPSGAFSVPYPSGALFFNKSAPAGNMLTTPGEGTITSWRFYTDKVGPGATVQLYALTPAGAGGFTVDAAGPKEALAEIEPSGPEANDVLHGFTSDLAVPAGALLGVRMEYPVGGTIDPVYYLSASSWSMGCLGGACPAVPATGGTATASSYVGQLAMNATFEPIPAAAGGGTTPTCVGACGTPPATTTPAPTVQAMNTAPKKAICRKGKRLVHGRCVRKKHHKHKKKVHRR
jgi:hypothetical protein